jgi:hypothetical protein
MDLAMSKQASRRAALGGNPSAGWNIEVNEDTIWAI